MKIFIACSKHHYNKIPEIKNKLQEMGPEISLPNSYDNPLKEEELKKLNKEEHIKWKSEMMRKDKTNIEPNEAILVLNCQEPPLKDWWHEDAPLRVVLEHTQNSTSDSNHSSKTSGILMFEKDGQENYIGGATFLEIYKAWELGKKIFLLNPIPENIFKDELTGINPTILNENLELLE